MCNLIGNCNLNSIWIVIFKSITFSIIKSIHFSFAKKQKDKKKKKKDKKNVEQVRPLRHAATSHRQLCDVPRFARIWADECWIRASTLLHLESNSDVNRNPPKLRHIHSSSFSIQRTRGGESVFHSKICWILYWRK